MTGQRISLFMRKGLFLKCPRLNQEPVPIEDNKCVSLQSFCAHIFHGYSQNGLVAHFADTLNVFKILDDSLLVVI